MGVPNSQLTTIFSAKYRLTTIFWPVLTVSLSYSEYHSVITRIFLPSLLRVGPKIKVQIYMNSATSTIY